MITHLRLIDFKGFADETLAVGPFTVLVGANASGKSNLRDAFRFFHGIGRGYTLADIIGGKRGTVDWEPLRGAPNELGRLSRPEELSRVQQVNGESETYHGFFLEIGLTRGRRKIKYSIGAASDPEKAGNFRVFEEHLKAGRETIYTSHPGEPDPVERQGDDAHLLLRMGQAGKQKKGLRVAVRPERPALTQIAEQSRVGRAHKDAAQYVAAALGRMRFWDFAPNRMREPVVPGQTVLDDSGANLPAVLRHICADPRRKADLISWTQELTPLDVADFEFPADAAGRIQLVVCEDENRKFSAHSISDGTLRFLAALAAMLDEDAAGLYFFEEIDSGIHPARVRLLADLVERRTASGKLQAITTTHSPDMLTAGGDETFAHTSVVCRLPDTSEAIIRPVPALPNAAELRRTYGLGRLHASGWMENAIAFLGGGENAA